MELDAVYATKHIVCMVEGLPGGERGDKDRNNNPTDVLAAID